MRVPGVVEAVVDEVTDNHRHLSPGREKHRLGLRQMGLPFASIPMPKKVLETLFDILEGICIFVVIRYAHMFVSIAFFALRLQYPSLRCQCRKCNVHRQPGNS